MVNGGNAVRVNFPDQGLRLVVRRQAYGRTLAQERVAHQQAQNMEQGNRHTDPAAAVSVNIAVEGIDIKGQRLLGDLHRLGL